MGVLQVTTLQIFGSGPFYFLGSERSLSDLKIPLFAVESIESKECSASLIQLRGISITKLKSYRPFSTFHVPSVHVTFESS